MSQASSSGWRIRADATNSPLRKRPPFRSSSAPSASDKSRVKTGSGGAGGRGFDAGGRALGRHGAYTPFQIVEGVATDSVDGAARPEEEEEEDDEQGEAGCADGGGEARAPFLCFAQTPQPPYIM